MYSTELSFEVVTPVSSKFQGTVTEVILPGYEGEMAVLGGHEPLVTLLSPGVTVAVESGASRKVLSTGPGFATIVDNKVVCLVDFAYELTELDLPALRLELEQLKAQLEKNPGDAAARMRKDRVLAQLKAESYGT